jgi:hypothetical protein
MSKHTPGPWHIGTPPPNGEQTIGNDQGMMVAVATTGIGLKEETMANARLIAAAPEMFRALEKIMPFLQMAWQDIPMSKIQKGLLEGCACTAIKAINKAMDGKNDE